MKLKNLKYTLLTLCIVCALMSYAQDNKKEIKATTLSLVKAFEDMHQTKLNKKNLPCGVEKIAEEFKIPLGAWSFDYSFGYLQKVIDSTNSLKDIVEKGEFSTKFDRVFEMFNVEKSYGEFISDVTNRNVSELTIAQDKKLKQIYSLLKRLHKEAAITSFDADPLETGNCHEFTKFLIKVKKKNLGQVTWEITTNVSINCSCKYKNNEIETLIFEYKAEVSGLFTAKKKTFGKIKNPTFKIVRYQCCSKKEEEKKEEDPKIEPDKNENINDLMPDQTIGFGAGVGFAQDFEETTFCVTGEYLYQINSDEENGLYVGAQASYENTSFGDFSSSAFKGGPKLQYNFAVTPSQETQFVAGIMANYVFGNNDNNGFADDFTGVISTLYGGVNIRLSENWSVGGQFPIFIYENFTFQPEFGDDFDVDGTSLFINKNNPLMIVVRRRL